MERGAKVSAVDGGVSGRFWVVEVFAFTAVELDGLDVGKVGHAGWEERVVLAHDTGTFAKVAFFVFLKLNSLSLSVLKIYRNLDRTNHFG